MALALASILLKLLSDHNKVINTECPAQWLFLIRGGWCISQHQAEKPSNVSEQTQEVIVVLKLEYASESQSDGEGGGEWGWGWEDLLRHTLLSPTPRVSDSAGQSGPLESAFLTSSQVLLVGGLYTENHC